jgi:NAD(P)-dependent dehydrogenase (short-subunit alcohol dehydrogenase family)
MNTSGKVALVTGGASGIGRACVARFVADGYRVIVGDLNDENLARVVDECGDAVSVRRCDVTVEADIEMLCAHAIEVFGRLDVAVANAGRGTFGMIVDHSVEEFRSVVDLCLTGVFLTIKHAGRVMSDGGAIVTISSLNGTQPSSGMSAYCAAKAGVIMLTEVAAMELGGRGIRVNAVGPGLIETPATGTFFALPGVVDEFVENTTLGRHGAPSEVAALVAWLASDESRFVSGSFHRIDGGASTKRYPNIPAAIRRAQG